MMDQPEDEDDSEDEEKENTLTAASRGVQMNARVVKQMGRMLNQNNFGDIAEDFKYWNDLSDKHKSEGSFCPLWQFQCDREAPAEKRDFLQVTSLSMGNQYGDLFAVGLGSLQFGHSTRGKVLAYSFKNLLEPEFECSTKSGVLKVRFSVFPSHPHLLAFSCMDGVVGICDLAKKNRIVTNYETEGRHIGPVWDVAWNLTANLTVEQPNMISVGCDGRVVLWSVTTLHKLVHLDLLYLKTSYSMPAAPVNAKNTQIAPNEGMPLDNSGGEILLDKAKAIEFQPNVHVNNEIVGRKTPVGTFLVATEQGWIYMCNSRHRNRINSGKWQAHGNCSVEKLAFNYFNSDILLTVGGDWNLKIWKLNSIKLCALPCITIQMSTHFRDAVWASYSSTCFTTVTHDRQLLFYNLAESRSHPVRTQAVVGKRSHTTRVLLSDKDPVVFVGDSKGEVAVLKLSPNLRKQWICDNMKKKKSAADKEREKANLENERAVQQQNFENERKLLLKVLALEEHYSIYEAEQHGKPAAAVTRGRGESIIGAFIGRARSKSRSTSHRRRSTSVNRKSYRASSVSKPVIRSRLMSLTAQNEVTSS